MKRARGPRGSTRRGAGAARTYFEAGPSLPGSRVWNIRAAVRPSRGGCAVPGAPGAVCRKGGARRFVGPESPDRGRPCLGGSIGRGLGLGRRAGKGDGAARKYSEAGPVRPSREGGRSQGLDKQVCSPSGGVRGAARTYSEEGPAPPQQVGGAAGKYSRVFLGPSICIMKVAIAPRGKLGHQTAYKDLWIWTQ